MSRFCGDGIRDAVLEECDDGPLDSDDTCTADCRVREAFVTAPLGASDAGPLYTVQRRLGSGPHVIAATRDGFVIVYQEADPAAHVWLQAFDVFAHRLGGPLRISDGRSPAGAANPVVAALPDGSYAVAWTDGFEGTPDVVLRSVDVTHRSLGPVGVAHDLGSGTQQDADILTIGDVLVVAWTDLFAVHVRRFDAGLTPVGEEEPLPPMTGLNSGVTLAAYQNGWALAWRANATGLESLRIATGTRSWQTELELPGRAGDRPALASVAAGHLLAVFSAGGAFDDAGGQAPAELRTALLDPSSTGTTVSVPLTDAPGTAANGVRPRIAAASGRAFLAWQSDDGARASQVFLAELHGAWDNSARTTLDRTILSSNAAGLGSLLNPALASLSTRGTSALVGAWEMETPAPGRPVPDLAYALRPFPFVRLDDGGG